MSVALASSIVLALAIYAALGALFGLAFVILGVTRVDPAARGTGPGFRLLILPGVAALWPLLALRWLRGDREPPAERSPHRQAAR